MNGMKELFARSFLWMNLFAIIGCSSCANSQKNNDTMKGSDKPKYTNSLINESSPYLLQHAHNPVNWVPWSSEAFENAKTEDKLVLVSIGYSSCHWCHVMEKESFEDESVAQLMNEKFICIKVDREERPDVDQVYMNAVQLMTGSGGWPLNCFTLPDGRPVYGGTYFPKETWKQILENLAYTYLKQKDKMLAYANELTKGIVESELIQVKSDKVLMHEEKLHEMVVNWKRGFDTIYGGPNRAPKFPMPNNYEFLLQYAWHNNDKVILNHVELTLEKMAFGGIFDQIGGGFARYSVDSLWKVPHFEKMLYDNAQLISLYSKAYQLKKNDIYKDVVYKTITWLYREMANKEGVFYSALDADSEGEEGKYYVWNEHELKSLLGENFELAKNYYNINENGFWEGNYILLKITNDDKFAIENKLSKQNLNDQINEINRKLLEARNNRVKPSLDDKSLTSWNALMIIALCDAYDAFGEEKFLSGAIHVANWVVKKQLNKDNSLLHSYKNGQSKIDGFLDDYAFTIEGFIRLYETTFDEKWITHANNLCEYAISHFHDEVSGMFFYTTSNATDLIARKMELSDNVIPSSNSAMCKILFKLGTILQNENYLTMSKQMLYNVYDGMETYGPAYSNWGIASMNQIYPFYEIAITGDNYKPLLVEFSSNYQPNKIIMGGNKSTLPLVQNKNMKEATIFVCVNKSCQMPVNSVSQALLQMTPRIDN